MIMALDGLVLNQLVRELHHELVGGRIDKIYQIEKEDILISMRNQGSTYKLLLTANSNYPRIHLTTLAKNNNGEPPMFCMLLRKHLGGGKLLGITQPDMERIVCLSIEATNELGDKEIKKLVIEIMGRHSNIILMKEDGTIIDSIKHITLDKSSVREILPNRTYKRPPSGDKLNPLAIDASLFKTHITVKELPIFKALYMSFNGLSPLIAQDICTLSHVESDLIASNLSDTQIANLFAAFDKVMNQIRSGHTQPTLYLDEKELPYDFYAFELTNFKSLNKKTYPSLSELLEHFYFERSTHFNVAQKTADIKKLLHTFLERSVRKKQIQEKALEEASQKDLYKIYGELLTAYAFQVESGASSFTTLNYYEEPYTEITISLDAKLSPIENAQAYYKLYNKSKRTELAAKEQLQIIEEDIAYLQSVLLSLDLLETREDIAELRTELVEMGYLKKRKGLTKNKSNKKDLPFLHFTSSKGHDIYVGKNNYQNDALTMKFAKPNDLWLHIKDGPGSHVIIKNQEDTPISDEIIYEAAMLAAYHSSGKMSSHVAIDYTYKRYVKKVPNAKPGMVIYTNFKTLYVTPTESFVKKLSNG